MPAHILNLPRVNKEEDIAPGTFKPKKESTKVPKELKSPKKEKSKKKKTEVDKVPDLSDDDEGKKSKRGRKALTEEQKVEAVKINREKAKENYYKKDIDAKIKKLQDKLDYCKALKLKLESEK
jgi:hypothetical protein